MQIKSRSSLGQDEILLSSEGSNTRPGASFRMIAVRHQHYARARRFDDRLNGLVDVAQRFGPRGSLRDGAKFPQGWAVVVVAAFAGLYLVLIIG